MAAVTTPKRRPKDAPPRIIRFSAAACPLGRVGLAATDRGVCAVWLGGTDADLAAFLRAEFPGAELRSDEPGLSEWLADLTRHLAGELPELKLPLDVRGTAFQRRVWAELGRIPRGETRTYRQLTAAVGNPAAVRAAARACATNPAAVVVPCHRVVGSDGTLTGYRWGLDRKRKLLDLEGRAYRPARP